MADWNRTPLTLDISGMQRPYYKSNSNEKGSMPREKSQEALLAPPNMAIQPFD